MWRLRKKNMKKIIPFLCLLFCVQYAFAQKDATKEAFLKFAAYKDDDKKVDSLLGYDVPTLLINDAEKYIAFGQWMLKQSLKGNDLIFQSYSYETIGNGYRLSGNSSKGLPYLQKASDCPRARCRRRSISEPGCACQLATIVTHLPPEPLPSRAPAGRAGNSTPHRMRCVFALIGGRFTRGRIRSASVESCKSSVH